MVAILSKNMNRSGSRSASQGTRRNAKMRKVPMRRKNAKRIASFASTRPPPTQRKAISLVRESKSTISCSPHSMFRRTIGSNDLHSFLNATVAEIMICSSNEMYFVRSDGSSKSFLGLKFLLFCIAIDFFIKKEVYGMDVKHDNRYLPLPNGNWPVPCFFAKILQYLLPYTCPDTKSEFRSTVRFDSQWVVDTFNISNSTAQNNLAHSDSLLGTPLIATRGEFVDSEYTFKKLDNETPTYSTFDDNNELIQWIQSSGVDYISYDELLRLNHAPDASVHSRFVTEFDREFVGSFTPHFDPEISYLFNADAPDNTGVNYPYRKQRPMLHTSDVNTPGTTHTHSIYWSSHVLNHCKWSNGTLKSMLTKYRIGGSGCNTLRWLFPQIRTISTDMVMQTINAVAGKLFQQSTTAMDPESSPDSRNSTMWAINKALFSAFYTRAVKIGGVCNMIQSNAIDNFHSLLLNDLWLNLPLQSVMFDLVRSTGEVIFDGRLITIQVRLPGYANYVANQNADYIAQSENFGTFGIGQVAGYTGYQHVNPSTQAFRVNDEFIDFTTTGIDNVNRYGPLIPQKFATLFIDFINSLNIQNQSVAARFFPLGGEMMVGSVITKGADAGRGRRFGVDISRTRNFELEAYLMIKEYTNFVTFSRTAAGKALTICPFKASRPDGPGFLVVAFDRQAALASLVAATVNSDDSIYTRALQMYSSESLSLGITKQLQSLYSAKIDEDYFDVCDPNEAWERFLYSVNKLYAMPSHSDSAKKWDNFIRHSPSLSQWLRHGFNKAKKGFQKELMSELKKGDHRLQKGDYAALMRQGVEVAHKIQAAISAGQSAAELAATMFVI